MTKRTKICGMKPRTEPTPPMMPSTTSDTTTSEAPAPVSQPVTALGMESTKPS